MKRMTANGFPIIRVKTYTNPDDEKEWSYAWAGAPLYKGDQFIVKINGREWEVEVVGYGTDYDGYLRTIGGDYRLDYEL